MIAVEGYVDHDEPNVRRTPLEDGAIAQHRITTSPFRVRRAEIFVYEENVTAFRAWIRAWGHTWFNWTDSHDGVSREARIRGGAGTVQLQRVAGRFLNGQRYRTAQVELEGY